MKNIIFLFALLLGMALFLVGCGESPLPPDERTTQPSSDEAKEVTVTFNSNGGSETPEQSIKKGEKVVKPADPEKTGYTFTKWTYQGEEWSFIGYSATTDMTLDANWKPIVYSVSYDLNGGYTNGVLEYTIESENVSLTEANKNGYEFGVW